MSIPVIEMFFHAPSFTLSYAVKDPLSNSAVIIDPALDYDAAAGRTSTRHADRILQYVEDNNLKVEWILETHAHADHISAASYLREKTGGKIAIGEGICEVQKTFSKVFNINDLATDGSQFDRLLQDNEKLPIGNMEVTVIHTPGHTNDSVSYLIGDAVFIGDTLFAPDFGSARTDFPGGDARYLYRSIHRLFELPDSTRVFLCHDYMPAGRELEYVHSLEEHKQKNVHINETVTEQAFVSRREARDEELGMPGLIIPSIQINIRAGQFPSEEDNGVAYLKVPLNYLGKPDKAS
jgi:glyoxylase-like metal-dependent hydrolase (beta-lactamase superfamily II)